MRSWREKSDGGFQYNVFEHTTPIPPPLRRTLLSPCVYCHIKLSSTLITRFYFSSVCFGVFVLIKNVLDMLFSNKKGTNTQFVKYCENVKVDKRVLEPYVHCVPTGWARVQEWIQSTESWTWGFLLLLTDEMDDLASFPYEFGVSVFENTIWEGPHACTLELSLPFAGNAPLCLCYKYACEWQWLRMTMRGQPSKS